MTSYHQVLKSDLVIVPSAYARDMFPSCLHERIVPQMEGFDITRKPSTFAKEEGVFHIGFSARDLSSAKGFEQFILIAKEILKVRPQVRFVFCGAPKVLYSYEEAFLQNNFPVESRPESFMQYVLQREGITLGEGASFQHVSFAGYDDFASYVEAMDMFLYPLQFGSANWGLFELLFRGKKIVASDRCLSPRSSATATTGCCASTTTWQAGCATPPRSSTPAEFRPSGRECAGRCPPALPHQEGRAALFVDLRHRYPAPQARRLRTTAATEAAPCRT